MVQYLDNSNKHFIRKFIVCQTICLLVSLENIKLLTKNSKIISFSYDYFKIHQNQLKILFLNCTKRINIAIII